MKIKSLIVMSYTNCNRVGENDRSNTLSKAVLGEKGFIQLTVPSYCFSVIGKPRHELEWLVTPMVKSRCGN